METLNIKEILVNEDGVVGRLFSKKSFPKKTMRFSYLEALTKNNMSEEEKQRMLARIIGKLKAGCKLTREEMEFLRENDPALYAVALRVQKMAEALEERLKTVKTKQEADAVIGTYTGLAAKDEEAREYMQAAFDKINASFHNSGAYAKLPNNNREAVNHPEKKNEYKGRDEDKEDKEFEEKYKKFNLVNWSPLDEVIQSLPSFKAQA